MKHLLLILLLPLLLPIPATASAAPTYDLSCDNVSRIRIGRLDDTNYNVESEQGHFHMVAFDLKRKAYAQFAPLVANAPRVTFVFRGEERTMRRMAFTAGGRPLRNDAPPLDGFSPETVSIAIVREKDAFDTARLVCPALVPRKVIVDWERREYK